MVTTGRRWYLMARDVDRDDWRTFRLDRMRETVATTWRFRATDRSDPVAYVQRSVTEAPYRHLAGCGSARPDRVASWVPPHVERASRTPATAVRTASAG